MKNDNEPTLLLASEVAARLRIGLSTVYEMFYRGDLGGVRLGKNKGAIRIFRESLDDLLAGGRKPNPHPAAPAQQETPVVVTPPKSSGSRPAKSQARFHWPLVVSPPRQKR